MPGWLTLAQQASLPALALAALLGAIVAFIRVLPQLRKDQLDSDASLRSDLLARVAALENEVVTLRTALDNRRDRHAAEIADLQHDLHNEMASLDALILLAELNPAKVMEQIPKIKEMRQRHRERVALKRGAREAVFQGEVAA